MNTVNVRIEEKTKRAASKTLASLGLDMSTAVKMFLNQVVAEKGLPFTPTQNAQFFRAKWDAEVERAKKSRSYQNAHEALKGL